MSDAVYDGLGPGWVTVIDGNLTSMLSDMNGGVG